MSNVRSFFIRQRMAYARSCVGVFLAGILPWVDVARAEQLSFSLPQARSLALDAAVNGRPDVALSLTQQLLDKDDTDSAAHLARGTAFLTTRDWGSAYKGGRLAFRHGITQSEKYQAARVAAMAAFGADRSILAQYWMRRAGDFAETEVDRTRVEQQFRIIQAKSPWYFRFSASVSPSSNVNGGSESAFNIIEGVPYIGVLSADARALSGYIAQTNAFASYRFQENRQSRTQIEGSFFTKRVGLTDDARVAAPTFDAARLGVTSASFGVRHSFLTRQDGPLIGFRGGIRGFWQGGAQTYTALTAGVDIRHKLSPQLTFSGALGYEARAYDLGRDGEIRNASLGLTYTFANGNRLTAAILGQDSVLPQQVFSSHSVTGRLGFALGQPVGAFSLSGGLGVSSIDYPDYSLGFIPVPGGRRDEAVFVDLEATFTGLEFAGFSPSVRVRRTETDSNVSRYITSEWAVSVGIQSNF